MRFIGAPRRLRTGWTKFVGATRRTVLQSAIGSLRSGRTVHQSAARSLLSAKTDCVLSFPTLPTIRNDWSLHHTSLPTARNELCTEALDLPPSETDCVPRLPVIPARPKRSNPAGRGLLHLQFYDAAVDRSASAVHLDADMMHAIGDFALHTLIVAHVEHQRRECRICLRGHDVVLIHG